MSTENFIVKPMITLNEITGKTSIVLDDVSEKAATLRLCSNELYAYLNDNGEIMRITRCGGADESEIFQELVEKFDMIFVDEFEVQQYDNFDESTLLNFYRWGLPQDFFNRYMTKDNKVNVNPEVEK